MVSYFQSLTWRLAVTLAGIEGDVAKTTSVFVPASAEVDTAVKPALDEKPSWENRRRCLENTETSIIYVIYNEKLMK